MFFPRFDCRKCINKFLSLNFSISDSMHSVDKADIFSWSKDDLKSFFILFKIENEQLSLAFEDGKMKILEIISVLENISDDDVIKVCAMFLNMIE